jgi:DNA mismatch repair ATPase MutS
MQENVKHYYQSRLALTQQALIALKRHIYYLGTVRLLIVLCTISSSYLLRSQGTIVIAGLIFIGLAVFLSLLLQYNRQQKKKNELEISAACDENELKAINYDFSAFDGAPEQIDAMHPFSLDLDIFGNRSLFQSINRTCTAYGKQVLSGFFDKPLQNPEKIKIRQKAVDELKGTPDFIHQFRVLGLAHPGKDSDLEEIRKYIAQPASFRSKKIWKRLRYVFLFFWSGIIVFSIAGMLPSFTVVTAYIITLGISECQFLRINKLQQWIGKKVPVFTSYSRLIGAVEQKNTQSELLTELKSHFGKDGKPASTIIRRLARLTNELEQRSNLMIHILLNPLLLWDINKAIQIEQWKEDYGKQLEVWIKTLGEYDAFCSLGMFAFNHPEYIFPELTGNYFEMEGKRLGHPLMNRTSCVRNDVDINRHPYFLIITGANMAGKSTYLRTVGVNFVLACIGAPVWADSLRLCPAGLVTSLRTSDSLNDNESYFFAELKRLKMIIDRLQADEKLFIVLDEILKGTNSVDKQRGSLALIHQFIRLQSSGIVATHDLLLGNLEKEFPENIRNCCFEADIKDEELTFSYRLREGIAQNMNATFLMKKMGITMSE